VAALAALAAVLSTACASTLARPDAARFPMPRPDAITFWGHCSCYIDVGGYGIVTDPVFETKLHVRRRKVPAPPPVAYAGARVILVSHAHDDHLSPRTIASFPESTLVLCPVPAAAYLKDVVQPVRPMRPGDEVAFPQGTIVAVPAHHPGGRRSMNAEADGRALGYVIRTPHGSIYVTGDTDLCPEIGRIGAQYQPEIVVMHISGHMKGMDAVHAARALGAPTIVPVHWGAYGYYWFPEYRQPRTMKVLRAELGAALVPLALGESLPLGRPAYP
jgi:L-ascorbate metabolism protein UlaG (beta-lactamase superfamily)